MVLFGPRNRRPRRGGKEFFLIPSTPSFVIDRSSIVELKTPKNQNAAGPWWIVSDIQVLFQAANWGGYLFNWGTEIYTTITVIKFRCVSDHQIPMIRTVNGTQQKGIHTLLFCYSIRCAGIFRWKVKDQAEDHNLSESEIHAPPRLASHSLWLPPQHLCS